jgi:hypothetical protein
LSFEVVFVVDRHLCEAHDFLAFLQKRGDADVLGEGVERVQITKNLLVGTLFVEFLEVLPIPLEGAILHDLH